MTYIKKLMSRLGTMAILMGLVFSASDLIHAENGYPETLYEGYILSNDSGGYSAYFENKDYDIKVVTSDNESYILRIWDVNAIMEEPYGGYIFESNAAGSKSWEYTFPKRGFYSLEIKNNGEATNGFILSYVRHKGIQEDFQIHSMGIAIFGAIIIIIGAMLKEGEG